MIKENEVTDHYLIFIYFLTGLQIDSLACRCVKHPGLNNILEMQIFDLNV